MSDAPGVPFPLSPETIGEYWLDAAQRGVLLLDALRQRGNIHREQAARQVPHVLRFGGEVIVDGRSLDRPVNYGLVRIAPPEGVRIDDRKRPFIVFDPRAGHGPGIAGMKQDSEIGVILAAGHPCYFVGFLPQPVPGQTVEDVCHAEAAFIETVARRHPEAQGKPCLIGNCQAGWQVMMTSAVRPDLPGPIMLAGVPLSYWAGVRGRNPMRYLGGLLGGTWLTALAGDLGGGIFDGANLVANFEALHPANTLWQKLYDLYAKIDTGVPRFLEFERWWDSPVLLTAEEMQGIVDLLFVGNKLAGGALRTREGIRVDLRNIRAPVIVFCSWGDDITPPQQALGWVLDLYDHDDELVAAGQTIVYTMHQSIGHLGLFVSGTVATREHEEFTQCMDLVDAAPPGLYEAVITEADETVERRDLVAGRYLFRLERRSLDDIRALGTNPPADERRFATVARVSDINLGLYRAVLSPVLRFAATGVPAETLRRLHPNRLRFDLFADTNPLMAPVAGWAERVRAERRPVRPDNPLLAMQTMVSDGIATALQTWTAWRDAMAESLFLGIYGAPLLQAAVGLGADHAEMPRHVERDLAREAGASHSVADSLARIGEGGAPAAILRAVMHVNRPGLAMDERMLAAFRRLAERLEPARAMPLSEVKALVRTQFLLLHHDEARAIEAIPGLLAADASLSPEAAFGIVRDLVEARGRLAPEPAARLARMQALFTGAAPPSRLRRVAAS